MFWIINNQRNARKIKIYGQVFNSDYQNLLDDIGIETEKNPSHFLEKQNSPFLNLKCYCNNEQKLELDNALLGKITTWRS